MNAITGQKESTSWKLFLQVYPFLDENIEKKMETELLSRFSPVFSKDKIINALANFCMAIRSCQNREYPRLTRSLDVDISTATNEVVRKITSACIEIWSSYDPIDNAYKAIKEVAEKMLPVKDIGMARMDNLGSVSIQLKTSHDNVSIEAFEKALRERSLPCHWTVEKIHCFTGVSVSILLRHSSPKQNEKAFD